MGLRMTSEKAHGRERPGPVFPPDTPAPATVPASVPARAPCGPSAAPESDRDASPALTSGSAARAADGPATDDVARRVVAHQTIDAHVEHLAGAVHDVAQISELGVHAVTAQAIAAECDHLCRAVYDSDDAESIETAARIAALAQSLVEYDLRQAAR
jgi:hypothetical protein